MIDELSIVMPCELDRAPLLMYTLGNYIKQGFPIKVEFIIVSRTIKNFGFSALDIRLVNYEWKGEYFNPSKALNIGVREAKYKNVMITCPEVYPVSNVLEQLHTNIRGNYICQVFDQNSDGKRVMSLVNSSFRAVPSMYFMAVFKKEDLEYINGWDEDFMGGYAWEDDDFGLRFKNSGLKYTMKDAIVGEHQYHPREDLGSEGGRRNRHILLTKHKVKDYFYCKNGLRKDNEKKN